MALTLVGRPGHGKSIFWSWRIPGGLALFLLGGGAMTPSETVPTHRARRTDWVAVVEELAPTFAARAAGHDADDTFVSENYADLRRRRVFSAAVPAELGGGGASHPEMCDVLRTLAQACSSTALALSMHTHQVLIPAWRWRQERAPVEPFLRRVAAEELVIATSGGSDWLTGSGRADKVEGGYRVSGRKIFASGSPGADIFTTMAIYDDRADHGMVGAMDTELAAARLAWRSMVDAANRGRVGPDVTNEVMIGRTLVGQAALRTVEAAMEVAGGAGFFRAAGLERLFRDVQGARYHALRGAAQRQYAGRLALGLDVND